MPEAIPDEVRDIPLEDIDPFVGQSREAFDEAEDRRLADNIQINGQLQPGVAWFDPGRNRYVLVCGERRLRALRMAGRTSMAVKVIRRNLTPGQMLQMNLAENIVRASINPIERGKAFQRLMQLEDLTASEVAMRMSVSDAMVSRDLSLLELPGSLQARVAAGEMPASVAAQLARIDDDETRRHLADQYGGGRLTRDGIAAEVRRKLKARSKAARPARLVFKLSGLSINVAGKPDKLTLDTLLSVLGRIGKEARSFKDAGNTDVQALAQLVKAP
jgi:ParB family chromosome partitioning protein